MFLTQNSVRFWDYYCLYCKILKEGKSLDMRGENTNTYTWALLGYTWAMLGYIWAMLGQSTQLFA